MKKIISLLLVVFMVVSFAACGTKPTTDENNGDDVAATLKFGMGIVASYGDAKDADGDTNGECKAETTAVAVLLDDAGKFVDIAIDTTEAKAAWTSEGVASATEEVKTKYELGTAYNMAAYGKKHDGTDGKVLEWFEQIDAFVATAKGKTLDEVKAFVGEDTYTTGDLAAAGCTISVGSIMAALEEAVKNAAASEATAEDTVKIAFATSVENTDATEEKEGSVEFEETIVAAVTDKDGKVVVAKTDCAQIKVTFDTKGVATVDTAAEIKTKLDLGTDYNMAAYGKKHDGSDGAVKEWFEQAAAFDAALVGKTASEFASLADADGYGTGDLATAGCTIGISDMIKAADKAAK
ncbi:MAG: hypothetical protein J6K49_07140 [Clostridia bacterium]|nr:hypothetical protein [Clostridia bacterium]